ncbi:MAG: hypothetical protein K2Y28_05125 [Burkholderiaceae bacterium]|nr:hypothetical protein [Burkholderiaceae bacterium]
MIYGKRHCWKAQAENEVNRLVRRKMGNFCDKFPYLAPAKLRKCHQTHPVLHPNTPTDSIPASLEVSE